jgi:predicted Kef-type K+ transport protein
MDGIDFIQDLAIGLHQRDNRRLLEDVVAVVMLAVLGAQVASAEAGSPAIGTLLIGLLAFVVLLVITGLLFIPRLLQRLDTKGDPELQTIIVAAGPRVGGSLAGLQIQRQTGVLVVGIDHAGGRVVNPAGDQTINQGDELLVLGTPEQVRRFKRWLTED